MLVVDDSRTSVKVRCPACGTEQILQRFVSRLATGRERCEPEAGQWLPCRACQEWSPIEVGSATAVGRC
jgi:predicted RNA-binding Zn-ribbon protein involved in translation (DUF1610 family)